MENQDLLIKLAKKPFNSDPLHETTEIQDIQSTPPTKQTVNSDSLYEAVSLAKQTDSDSLHETAAVQDLQLTPPAKQTVNSYSLHEAVIIQNVPSTSPADSDSITAIPSTKIINLNGSNEISRDITFIKRKHIGRAFRKSQHLVIKQLKELPPQEVTENETVDDFFHGVKLMETFGT
ncbi:hypothetical protein RclHR1_00110028 [Rhizophagus clarus]|uniref:Uncharacterized protein n=1 Tax=Rhizophagus clarus TaxID=94130 RepID=A0A2Z6Q4M2_9GLOM|nr:hypothetical protein RclHR1_00110028 [Rhizophagus clarus]